MTRLWTGVGATLCMGLMAACSPQVDEPTPDSNAQSQCNGEKCDGVSGFSELEVQTNLTTGVCVWTGQANDTMKLECAMGTLIEGATHQHTGSYVYVKGDFLSPKTMNFQSTELDGKFREVASIVRSNFEREPVSVETFVSLGGANGNGQSFGYFIDVPVPNFLEEGERQEFELGVPFDLRPISFWPSPEVVDIIDNSNGTDLLYINLENAVDLAGVAGFRFDDGSNSSVRSTIRSGVLLNGTQDPRDLAGKVVYVPVPIADMSTTVQAQLIMDSNSQPKYELAEPGYYVVNADATLTLTAPADLPDIGLLPPAPIADMGPGMLDMPGGDFGTDDMGVDSAPDMPPADPCMDQCTGSEVCVAGACVSRARQAQTSCNTPSERACDLGEDQDCAEGNVCVEGTCRWLLCQKQSSCNQPAERVCEGDDDCGENNICVEGMCRWLLCQKQVNCSDPADRVCADVGDCADGNVCVDNMCRRLICQKQDNCSDSADRVCDGDDNCADGNICVAGMCRRLICQKQDNCSDPADRVCEEANGDCANNNTCVNNVCVRDVCM